MNGMTAVMHRDLLRVFVLTRCLSMRAAMFDILNREGRRGAEFRARRLHVGLDVIVAVHSLISRGSLERGSKSDSSACDEKLSRHL
jgi:hypothetical protein